MKIVCAGDISFDWLPPPGWRQVIATLFARSPLPADLVRDLGKFAGVNGWAGCKLNTQASMLGRRLHDALRPATAGADVFCVNLECVLSSTGAALEDKKYTLRAAPHFVQTLKLLGVSHVCLANNHILDYGLPALADTRALLDRAGIAGLGLRFARAARQAPAVVERNGGRVALLNYVDPGIIDPDPEHYLSCDPSPFPLDPDRVLDDVRAASHRGAVVVVTHWGEEWSFLESDRQRGLARAMIDAGAAVVVSHHTHLAGSCEEYRDGLIAYGLGNLFMMVPGFSMLRGCDRLMVELDVSHDKLAGYRLIPLSNDGGVHPQLSRWPVASMRPGYLPSGLDGSNAILDTYAHLEQAKVGFETNGRTEQSVWAADHLAPFEAVEGKLPVGPGWRVSGRPWCGVARSREQGGREFVEVCAAHLDGPGKLTATWELPAGTRMLRFLYGYPEYLRMLDSVVAAELSFIFNGQTVAPTRLPETINGWQVDDLTTGWDRSAPGRLEVMVTNRTDRQAFCCFRLLAACGPPAVPGG